MKNTSAIDIGVCFAPAQSTPFNVSEMSDFETTERDVVYCCVIMIGYPISQHFHSHHFSS
jgi:hypothetical protein